MSATTLCPRFPCFLFSPVSLLGHFPLLALRVGISHGSVLDLLIFPGDSPIFMPLWSPLLFAGGFQISIFVLGTSLSITLTYPFASLVHFSPNPPQLL